MPEQLTRDSYLQLVQKSGLVEKPRLAAFLDELRQAGRRPKEPEAIADELVAAALLTPWQARTLLKGRYKGFHLGKYKLLDLLGTGGMGSVYLAEHVLMRRKVAIKVLPLKRVGRKAYLQRFYREARAVAQLDHKNIVRAYDVDQDGDVHFLVMEYVDGTSLFRLIKQDGPLPPRRAADYIRQASEGLCHAFEAGLVHRDIKPGNLLIDRRGTVKLADLGLARFFSEDEGDDEPLTSFQKESVLGTVDYLAPEQALDSHTVDVRADIYSLGCTLYFLLTGQPPFSEGTMAQRLMYHQTREPAPLDTLRPDVPRSLVEIVEKMMAKEPGQRYQSPAALNVDLDRWLEETPDEPQSGEQGELAVEAKSGPFRARVEPEPLTPSGGAMLDRAVDARPTASTATAESTQSADGPDVELDQFLAKLEHDSASPGQAASPEDSSDALPVPVGAVSSEAAPSPVADGGFAPPDDLAARRSQAAERPSRSEQEAAPKPPAAMVAAGSQAAALEELVFEPRDETSQRADSLQEDVEAPPRDPRNRYFVAAAIVILVATVLVVLYPLVFLGKKEGGKTGGDAGARSGAPGGGAGRLTPRKPRPGPKRPLVWVKPSGGDFTSLAEALRAAEAGQIIRVAGGQTFRTRIELNGETFPEDVQVEVESGGRATLEAPDGPGPLMRLRGVKGLRMRGFDLDASGADVAVRLEGKLAGTRLSDMTIRGFARSGVVLYGCRGELHGRVFLGRIEFQAAHGTAAAGIVVQGDADEASAAGHIQIHQCRFDASLAQGVHFETAAGNVEVSRCVLAATDEGIVFEDVPGGWRSIAIANNTFFGMQRGIVFRRMPPEGSRDLSMCNNLFYNLTGAAGEVEQGYDDPRMVGLVLTTNPPGASHNWDNRPADATQEPAGALPLFGYQGWRGPFEADLVSTTPADPNFLRPRPKSRLAGAGAGGDLPGYVGALAPEE